MNNAIVGIIVGSGLSNEPEAIRQVLEYYGYKVLVFYLGRPDDFVRVISGQNQWMNQAAIWILSMHGQQGKFVMPELAEDIYFANEPRKDIGRAALVKYGQFQQKIILSTACTMGQKTIGETFLKQNAKVYIAPKGYIEGNAALLFISCIFYELQKGLELYEAFSKSQSIDEETALFRFFEKV